MRMNEKIENGTENSTFIKTKIRASGPITTRQIEQINMCKQWQAEFSLAPSLTLTLALALALHQA